MSNAGGAECQAWNPGLQWLLRQMCQEQPGRLGTVYRGGRDVGLFCGGAPVRVACLAEASAVLSGSPASSRTTSSSSATKTRTLKKRGRTVEELEEDGDSTRAPSEVGQSKD